MHKEGTYELGGENYSKLLARLLELHERSNAMGHNCGKHKVIAGDCRETLPKFFSDNPNEFVALAFFDVNSYEPTVEAFNAIYDRLIPGGIVAFWQLTRDVIPAEAMVYVEHILNVRSHELFRSPYYPGLCYVVKK